ncbi:DUF916 domain-containing protein [Bacillus shivajii]|uniref:WxL protein peptidoglycan domain-containing protein n=1 Tax=Bacillus shivajii TaxID=1983719 RepID=UPI001CFA9EE2|nr:DUF916 domain-containing protein [Bacillus shivajii]UCZ52145.1 DUF916 domain-containing protein [Bacillus shivajii]
MRRKVILLVILFIAITTVNFGTIATKAQQEMDAPFTVEPILPNNQVEGVGGYYHLQVEPNDEQTVYVRIENKRDHNISVQLLPINAYTAPTGGILYEAFIESERTNLLDEAVLMSNLLELESLVELSAHEEKEIPIHITVPENDSGTFLGGILFASVNDDTLEDIEVEEEEGDIGFIIRNEITFSIAVQLDLPEDAEPEFHVGDVGLNIRPIGPELYFEFINEGQMILRGTEGEYEIENEEGDELFSGEIPPFTMVPASEIRYPVTWENEAFGPGVYHIFAKINVLGEEITIERTLEVENEEVREYEEVRAVSPEPIQTGIPSWIWAAVGGVIAVIFYWLGSRKKK